MQTALNIVVAVAAASPVQATETPISNQEGARLNCRDPDVRLAPCSIASRLSGKNSTPAPVGP
jgi:hypothetical protein